MKRTPLLATLAVAIAVIANLSTAIPAVNAAHASIEDEMFRMSRRAKPEKGIILITVDSDRKQLNPTASPALPRSKHAELIKAITLAHPRVVLYDFFFVGETPGDGPLRKALAEVVDTTIVLAQPSVSIEDDKGAQIGATLAPLAFPTTSTGPVMKGHVGVLSGANGALGIEPYFHPTEPNVAPELHAVVKSACICRGVDPRDCAEEGANLDCNSISWPMGANGEIGLQMAAGSFQEVKYQDVLSMSSANLRSLLENKVVLVGDIRRGVDEVSLVDGTRIAGVRYNAAMLNTLLIPSRFVTRNVPLLVTLGWSAALAFLVLRVALRQRLVPTMTATLGALILAISLPIALLSLGNVVIETLVPILSVLLALVIAMALSLVWPNPGGEAGKIVDATVLFVDWRDSTPYVDEVGAASYQAAFVDFTRQAERRVQAHNGHLERTTGDGFIAVFRGSGSQLSALEAAAQIVVLPSPHGTRAALEYGPVSGGYTVEGGRKSWTSSGRTVNLAARLLSACDELGITIAIGPSAATFLRESRTIREVGEFSPKGLKSVTVFTPENEHGPHQAGR